MKISVEIPENSDDHHDYKCKECNRKIRFTPAFFQAGFEFPLTLTCARCKEIFVIDLKRTEYVLPEIANRAGKGPIAPPMG